MKPWLALLAALACAGLSACYTSKSLLLDPRQAVTPLAEGRQQAAGEVQETVEVTLLPDHWYRVRAAGKDEKLLITALPSVAGETRYAFALDEPGGYLYGLAFRQGGQIDFDLPFCGDDAARQAALRHGATMQTVGKAVAPTCTFADAASLTAALSDYAGPAAADRSKLTRLPAKLE